MRTSSSELLFLNNTGNKPKSTLIETFVIREKEFNQIISELTRSERINDFTNTLITGTRGAGKTTLIYRLKYAIEDDIELSQKYIPVIFSEEQYFLSDLSSLWESIAHYFEETYAWNGFIKKIDDIMNQDNFLEADLFNIIANGLIEKGKGALIFFENLNAFLAKLSEKEQNRFKQIITSNYNIRLIASSTSLYDNRIDFLRDFSFFKIVPLDGLDKSECEELLKSIGRQYGYEDKIEQIITNQPSRIESLRRLTGGVPRTIAYLFQIFLDNRNGKAIKDLYELVDKLTFLYKSELDQLSAQQQKIIDVIARKWDAMPVKEIAIQARLESKNVSTILSVLEKNQFIEIVRTNTKNNLYRIKERFMNIWYLMRFGRKYDESKIIWLVRFFDSWCDSTELAKIVTKVISEFREDNYDEEAAIDIGNTFLSCENLSHSMKMKLIEATADAFGNRLQTKLNPSNSTVNHAFKEYINKGKYSEALNYLDEIKIKEIDRLILKSFLFYSKGDFDQSILFTEQVLKIEPDNRKAINTLYKIFKDYLDGKKFDNAIKLLNDVSLRELDKLVLQSYFYYYKDDIEKSAEFAKKVLEIDPENTTAALHMGIFYEEFLQQVPEAKKYYELALNKKSKHPYAASRLGNLVYEFDNDVENARKYHNLAIKKGMNISYLFLGSILKVEEKYEEAEIYLKSAVTKKVKGAYLELAKLYACQNQDDKTIEYFNKSIKESEEDSLISFAEWYRTKDKPDYEKAILLFKQAMDENQIDAYHMLGELYAEELNQYEKAIEILNKGVEKNDANSAHELGHVYLSLNKPEKAIKYFVRSFDLGRKGALYCLAEGLYSFGKNKYKEFVLETLLKYSQDLNSNRLYDLLLAKIYLWNNEFIISHEIITKWINLNLSNLISKTSDINEYKYKPIIRQLTEYTILLIAKGYTNQAYNLFHSSNKSELKTILRPVYFALMEHLKEEFPHEYLKAGEEYTDTIHEIKHQIINTKKRLQGKTVIK